MSSIPAEAFRLPAISPKSYEHPADRAATAALASIPYLDLVVRKLFTLGYERTLRSQSLGGSIRLSDDQLPRVWALHHRAYDVLDVDPLPALYVTQYPMANAVTIGSDRPVVIINSELVSLLDDDGLRAVFAHEAGHVLSDHVMYQTALQILIDFTGLPRILGVPLAAVRMALMEWSRAGELTCDRAAALATRDPESVCRVLMSLAAGIPAGELNLGAFIRQAQEFSQGASGLEWLSRRSLRIKDHHPLSVQRTSELLDWVRSGEYDRIIRGEYIRRGEEPPVREATADAVEHYGERFKVVFDETSEQLEKAGKQINDWLSTGSDWVRNSGKSSGTPDVPDDEDFDENDDA